MPGLMGFTTDGRLCALSFRARARPANPECRGVLYVGIPGPREGRVPE
jgi:hypothetical protein